MVFFLSLLPHGEGLLWSLKMEDSRGTSVRGDCRELHDLPATPPHRHLFQLLTRSGWRTHTAHTGLLSELLTQWVPFCQGHHGPEAGKPSLPPWQCLSSVHGTLVPSTRR